MRCLEYSGRGTPPKGPFIRVDKLKQSLNDADWETIDIRDGEKKPLVMKLAVGRVMAHTEIGKHGSGDEEWLIVVERPKGDGVQCVIVRPGKSRLVRSVKGEVEHAVSRC